MVLCVARVVDRWAHDSAWARVQLPLRCHIPDLTRRLKRPVSVGTGPLRWAYDSALFPRLGEQRGA